MIDHHLLEYFIVGGQRCDTDILFLLERLTAVS